jgi:hypothetical protein
MNGDIYFTLLVIGIFLLWVVLEYATTIFKMLKKGDKGVTKWKKQESVKIVEKR